MKPSISERRYWTYWPFWALLAAMAAVLPPYVWHENTAGFLQDDGVYLMMADFFSPFFHGNSLVTRFMMGRSRFPPALPILIGLFGGGSRNMHAAHLVVLATFFASAVLFYAWARRTLVEKDVAAACLLIYALLPRTLIYVAEIWSEYLFMAFTFAAFVLMDKAGREREPPRELLCACALTVGLSMLTRTIGVALLAAFCVFLIVNAVKRKYLYVLLAAALPAFWQAVKILGHYHGGYTEDLDRYLSPGGIARLILMGAPHRAHLLLQSWNAQLSVTAGSSWPLQALAGALLLLALLGLGRRLAHRADDSAYALFYVAIILVWPHPAENIRFLYPLMPLALVYLFDGLRLLIRETRTRPRMLANAGAVAAMLLLIYPNTLFVLHRFLTPLPGHFPDDYRHTRQFLRGGLNQAYYEAEQMNDLMLSMKRIRKHVASDQCVYSAHPVSTMLYSQRMSILMPPNATIDKLTDCRYLFVMNMRAFYPPDYPLRRVDISRLKRLDVWRDRYGHAQAFLFKIRH
ncbi:MAG: hypothetical protein WB783_18445 [Arenicellales bacterium]